MATPTPPAESQDSILAALSNLFQGARPSTSDFSGVFNEALAANDAQTPPAPMTVPGTTNPFGGMAAIFAASLADQMGARGSLAGTQTKIQQQDEASAAATHENFAREQAFNDKKAMQRMGILLKIGEAKAKALEQQGDMDKYEAQVKANLMMADRARKLEEDAATRAAEQAHKNRLEEIMAAKKVTPEEKKAAAEALAQDKEDKNILRLQEDISNIAKKPGSMAKQKVGEVRFGPFHWGGADVNMLTPAAVNQIRGRAAATAKSAGGQRLREAALQTYLDTLRNPDTGEVDKSTPEFQRYSALINSVIPNLADRVAFAASIGFK